MSDRAAVFYRKMKVIWDRIPAAEDETSRAASSFLDALAGSRRDDNLVQPFRNVVGTVHSEFDTLMQSEGSERQKAFLNLEKLLDEIIDNGSVSDNELAETLWAGFFPEALHLSADPEEQIPLLRNSRLVNVEKVSSDPVVSPEKEIIFTSNVLLSPPVVLSDSEKQNGNRKADSRKSYSDEIQKVIDGAALAGREKQSFWYDHPIPVGTPVENDEAVYGLSGLAKTLAFEKERGNVDADARLKVLLSVSVTHSSLHEWALPWLRVQLARAEKDSLKGLDVYAFTEEDSSRIVELLKPWIRNPEDFEDLQKTFGVDGEYGRHYSFLKAMPALWSVLEDPGLKATFKIDLDQVFPQEELVNETGRSAFEHFRTDLWGALGKDNEGRNVELGMIAGALVNEKDIHRGLFTPDIPWPEGLPEGENMLFYKLRPMAVSTRAELMTRYEKSDNPQVPDGVNRVLQRIHVTGGTNGIRFDALRFHRPFTPSFIGRAEDQGYILSVLHGRNDEAKLRYVHASGLFMRHDKEAFAGAAVEAGKTGSYVGDLIRVFVFSHYADILPGGKTEVKKIVDPFTGCFISEIPVTISLLRLALFMLDSRNDAGQRKAVMKLAGERLPEWVLNKEAKAAELKRCWVSEKKAWNSYFDALNLLEEKLSAADKDAEKTARMFHEVLENCRIT